MKKDIIYKQISGGWIWAIVTIAVGIYWMPHGYTWGFSALYQHLGLEGLVSTSPVYLSLIFVLKNIFKTWFDPVTSVTFLSVIFGSISVLYFYKLVDFVLDDRMSAHLSTGAFLGTHLFLWNMFQSTPENLLIAVIPIFMFYISSMKFGDTNYYPFITSMIFFIILLISPCAIVLLPLVWESLTRLRSPWKKIIVSLASSGVLVFYIWAYYYNPYFRDMYPFHPSVIVRLRMFIIACLYQYPPSGWIFIVIGYFYLRFHIPDINNLFLLMISMNIIFYFIFSPVGSFYYLAPVLIILCFMLASGIKWIHLYTLRSPERLLFATLIFGIMLWIMPQLIYTFTPPAIERINIKDSIAYRVPGRNEWMYRFNPWSHKRYTPEIIFDSVEKYTPPGAVILTNMDIYYPLLCKYKLSVRNVFLLIPPGDQTRFIRSTIDRNPVFLLGYNSLDFDRRGILHFFTLESSGPFFKIKKE